MESQSRVSVAGGGTDANGIPVNAADQGRCAGCAILVMDGDRSAFRDLEKLLVPQGFSVRAYVQLKELLDAGIPESRSCLLMLGAVRNGRHFGLEVLAELRRRNWNVPIVLMSKRWNVQLVVDAMRAGADGFVPRPFDSKQLLAALSKALAGGRHGGCNGFSIGGSHSLLSSLNFREREVVRLVMRGLLNKEIACRMGLALVTVKVYRSRAMKKLGAGNAAELAKIATLGGLDTDIDVVAS